MRRFRDEGFLMVAARPPVELASAAQAAGGNRRSMQDSASNPMPAPLLQVPPGLANSPAPPDPAEITEYRITPSGQVFARPLTPADMAIYNSQRSRSSAASDSGPGITPNAQPSTPDGLPESVSVPRPSEKREMPSPAPSERRELQNVATVAAEHAVPRLEDGEEQLEEEYSIDVNDVYVDDDSYGDGEADGAEREAEQKDWHEESAVDAKTSGLQKRRRLSYVIPVLDDRLEETTDVYPGRASGRFNYRNPVDGRMYFCSGTLISNNAVLLAAHCVVDVTRSPVVWMDTFSFAPGARSGVAPFGTATVKFVSYTSLYTSSTPGNDLAVAILNTQPGDLTGWLSYGYDCLPTSYQVNTTGYPSDKIFSTRWRANCTTPAVNPCTVNVAAGLAPIECDTMAGQSGSAVFSNSAGGPRARFIVAYEARNATTQWNGAAVINQNTFPFIDNLVKTYRVFSPPPPPPSPSPPPSPPPRPRPPPSPPPRPPPPPTTVKGGRRSLRQSLQKLLRRQ
ncbi:hypothetical protein HYH02_014395 [Chlamydomonas schloesseri]|uniref:Peptidase S1 domain-containing protein n=1 Tax=Chlamydomonas schloesseri TaxID=2026947 RepID=A0A835SJW6_9CHLO|nr:hypothetical protein HYH02_014395 [Chlamydomonas schloesseri]|eukprot:KAG2428379.1 hypothetical protein HYH02_014395 [Chlamydomonas schloesseri]